MKATIKIEAIGDNADAMLRTWRDITDSLVPGLGAATFGYIPKNYWVAEIMGKDPKYKYRRIFLRGKKDYTHSNSQGSRGIYIWYTLESGRVYEVNKPVSWKHNLRYFCRVDENGDVIKIDQEEIEQWIPKENTSSG